MNEKITIEQFRKRNRHLLQEAPIPKVKVDPKVHKKLDHGWLLPALIEMDDLLWGRWEYWYQLILSPELPDQPIPKIKWQGHSNEQTRKMLKTCLNAIPRHGEWLTWSSWKYFRYFLRWLLYGFGHHGHTTLPPEPSGCQGASDRLFQLFQLGLLQLHPYDYWGELLALNQYGKRQGFFPTPIPVASLMAEVLFTENTKDQRLKIGYDPCCGTGRFPLLMSNYLLRVFAQDINETLILATLVNYYLYAPWLAQPIPWLNDNLFTKNVGTQQKLSNLSDQLTNQTSQARPDIANYLKDTEFDSEGLRFTPILKRKRKSKKSSSQPEYYQGNLF